MQILSSKLNGSVANFTSFSRIFAHRESILIPRHLDTSIGSPFKNNMTVAVYRHTRPSTYMPFNAPPPQKKKKNPELFPDHIMVILDKIHVETSINVLDPLSCSPNSI